MKTIKFNAHRGDKLLSRLIRLFSRGIYNHISMELDGFVYEAHIKKGVTKTKVRVWDNSTVAESMELSVKDEYYPILKDFLERQVGKKYDIRGIFAFLFLFARPRMGYWYCSELAKIALCYAIGYYSVTDAYSQTESPHSFWINLKLVAKVKEDARY